VRSLGRVLAVAVLTAVVALGLHSTLTTAAGQSPSSVSDTIEDPESGIVLDFTVHGGTITAATPDGWEYSIEGTARPGETISIAASGHGTTWTGRHHVNEDREASLDIWFDGTDVREHVTLPPGESGSLGASYVVPPDASTVRAVATIGNTWINPYGGGSRTLIVRISIEVVEPETVTTEPPTTRPPPTEPPDDEDCDYPPDYYQPTGGNPIVRFGDLHGEVNVRPNCEDDDAYIFAELSTPLHHDDRIRTLRRSGAILSYSDMSTFVMREDSTIVLDIKNERESKIGLVAGTIWVNLQRMIEDGSFEVEMSQAVAGIKGTTFVARESGATSTVRVFEGVVEMRPNVGEPVLVGPGQSLQVTAEGAGPLTAFDMDGELEAWDDTVRRITTASMDITATDAEDGGAGLPTLAVGVLVALVAVGALAALAWRRRAGLRAAPRLDLERN